MDKVKIFTGNGNPELAKKICKSLNLKLGDSEVIRFSDGETRVKIKDNVRGADVFVVQPTCYPANENLMELLIMIDALRRSSAKRITAVLPYFGYARQDRKDQPRVPITAKLVANLLTRAGANRIITIDLHAGQIQGFFDIPLDHLYAVSIFAEYFKKKKITDIVVVSPDVGGIKMARAYAKRFDAGLAIVDKRRISDVKAEVMHIMGDVQGKNVILVDDIVATAGSLTEAAAALKKNGAKDIYVAVTHAVLCGPAMERLKGAPIKEFVVTDTIPLPLEKKMKNIKQLSVAQLLGEAIRRIRKEQSISALFE
ncbi:MAG: ribose-phosphate pyrophosphokinase [Candidatus Omnitrophica bacterium]|nr:ribose-phosphate pyrophosphokinase [Candidatus Omnitrophota bacterium]MDD5488196.1 ribose-phosphate pyrophosphokinase [Candidatus Omnitrophota bacterium]